MPPKKVEKYIFSDIFQRANKVSVSIEQFTSNKQDKDIFFNVKKLVRNFGFDENRISLVFYFVLNLIKLLRDPFECAEFLKPLDLKLGLKLKENGCDLSKIQPKFIMSGARDFVVGPPCQTISSKKKHRALHYLLLEFERDHGTNLKGVADFVGFIPKDMAKKFISSANLFMENEEIGRMLLHGKYSHRLAIYIILSYIDQQGGWKECGFNDVKEFFKFLSFEVKNDKVGAENISAWDIVIDTVVDTAEKPYSFSCRSPFSLKAMVSCFGSDLDLPNLQRYINDSHYDLVEKMRLRYCAKSGVPIGFEEYYFNLMQDMSIGVLFGLIGIPAEYETDLLKKSLMSKEEAAGQEKYFFGDGGVLYKKNRQVLEPSSSVGTPEAKRRKMDATEAKI